MAYVITQPCCNDGKCVEVCPVDCIRPRPGDPQFTTAEQLYIDPELCIDCGACMDVCPVDAIHSDFQLPARDAAYLGINAEYFERYPITGLGVQPPAAAPKIGRSGHVGLRVAIIGAGPAGCYAAAALIKAGGVEITVIDRASAPYGLSRTGVAPDHQKTKMIEDEFKAVLLRPEVTCFFNVEVGRDVSQAEILQSHHAVIWSAGAASDRRLGIPGEDLPGCHAVREFVAWYNGDPDFAEANFDLSGRNAVVIGNGNVALDAARILMLDPGELGRTDIADHALAALRASRISEVSVVARRGPADAAYTLPELLAMSQLQGVSLTARADETKLRPPGYRGNPLKLELVEEVARIPAPVESRRIHLRYLLSPLSINGDGRVESVTFRCNELVLEGEALQLRPTEQTETIVASLVLRAAGYRSLPVPGLPFNEAVGALANLEGRVVDPECAAPIPGMYCAGWMKRGATGGLGMNKWCSAETVDALLADYAAGCLARPAQSTADFAAQIAARQPNALDFAAWSRIDLAERQAGIEQGRPRRKFAKREDMMAAARNHLRDRRS